MKKSLIVLSLAGVLAAGLALSQTISLPLVQSAGTSALVQILPTGQPSTGNVYANVESLKAWLFGSNTAHTGTPALTSCITGGGTIAGTDSAFILTGGSTSSTSCVATFSTAYAKTPVCTVSSQTAYGTTTASYAVSTTAVTITQASLGSEVYNVICVSQPGG